MNFAVQLEGETLEIVGIGCSEPEEGATDLPIGGAIKGVFQALVHEHRADLDALRADRLKSTQQSAPHDVRRVEADNALGRARAVLRVAQMRLDADVDRWLELSYGMGADIDPHIYVAGILSEFARVLLKMRDYFAGHTAAGERGGSGGRP